MNLSGRGSWFGGRNDSMDSGHTASGGTTAEPGIAVYNHGTLGGYWRVTAPNGRTVVVRQTDIGPAPWTGRKIDVTYSALNKFGYGEHNFPTDQGEFKAQYLGKNQPKGGTVVEAPPQSPPRAPVAAQTATPPGVQGFDQAGFQKAQRASVLGRLISEGGERKDNPLFATGLVSTKAPSRAEFTTAGTAPPAPARAAAPPSLPGTPQQRPASSGGKLGGFLPGTAELQYKRLDEGQDVQLKPGEVLHATGDYHVVAVKSDPSGFGPGYAVIKFTSGPQAGQTLYFGHGDSLVRQGQTGHAGEPIVRTSRTGHNAPPGWLEIGKGETLGQGDRGQGREVARYLR